MLQTYFKIYKGGEKLMDCLLSLCQVKFYIVKTNRKLKKTQNKIKGFLSV